MINIFNLNKSRDEREINRFTTYRKILEKCHRRIQINSDKKVTHCIFTVPKMVIGLPAYDQVKCAEYCIDKLKKMIKSMGEKCKISIRNIRRDANEELKKLLKSKEIGEDEEKSFEKNVQTITDKQSSFSGC